ncbi:MAG: hypothetical protein P1P82_15535 [Bacteroidales bacterium]|nr:hypothetical protein [Bacteroidales bacterium]MDT8430723.1 hypothetical protein [Bacteroidales bacterium]
MGENNEKHWRMFYLIGAVCAFSAAIAMITEVFLTALPDGARVQLTGEKLLELYNRNWFMGMRYMGFMNIIAFTILIPVNFSLYGVHRKTNGVFALFTLIIALIGYAVFLSDNTSFPILELSKRYAIANESDRLLIVTATETLFAKGASHTPGTFPGFLLGQMGSILFSILIIQGKIFKPVIGFIGIIAFTFLLVFEVISTFIHSLYDQAMIFAMIGGIMAIIWLFLIGIALKK